MQSLLSGTAGGGSQGSQRRTLCATVSRQHLSPLLKAHSLSSNPIQQWLMQARRGVLGEYHSKENMQWFCQFMKWECGRGTILPGTNPGNHLQQIQPADSKKFKSFQPEQLCFSMRQFVCQDIRTTCMLTSERFGFIIKFQHTVAQVGRYIKLFQ